jgi:hypothetical protein
MDEGHSRIQVIQIDTNASSICLINVYMASDNKEMDCEYKDMICSYMLKLCSLFVLMTFRYGGKMYLSLDNVYLGLSYSLEGIF